MTRATLHDLPCCWKLLGLSGLLACGMAFDSAAQAPTSPFDLPPNSPPAASAVRGLGGAPQSVTSIPSQPAGAAQAPPATFTRPAAMAAMPGESDLEPTQIAGSEIIARINGDVVLASDLNWQIDQMIASIAERGTQIPPNQMDQFRQVMLRRQVMGLVDTKLLYAEFRRTAPAEALPKVEESLKKAFEEFEVPRLLKVLKLNDRVELEAKLKESGASLKDVQRQFQEKTIAGEWLKQKLPKDAPITHEQMLAYYQDHLKEYEQPAQARWEELAVRFDRFNGDRDAAWQALCEMGNEVWKGAAKQPNVTGPVFGDVAKARSQGFNAPQGGQHDWTTLGDLKCEALNDALQTLAVGQLSDGIESEQGFHIVRVLERRDAGRTPFTEAQVKIRETLTAEQKEAAFVAVVAKLRKGARVWTLFDGEMSSEQVVATLDAMQQRR